MTLPGWPIQVRNPPPSLVNVDPPGSMGALVAYHDCAVGDAWYASRVKGRWHVFPKDDFPVMWLSPQYHQQHEARRPPIMVVLPSKYSRGQHIWCVDSCTIRDGKPGATGWQVTGDLGDVSRFSLSPSINIVGDYHGFIRSGVLTPDCEGRVYG